MAKSKSEASATQTAAKEKSKDKKSSAKSSSANGGGGSSGSGKSSVRDNITLITNGFRARLREDGSREVATLDDARWNSQEELHKLWEKRVGDIEESDYVLGAGDPGIFSARFGKQVEQIAPIDNVWCYSSGLGMVNLGAKYPQFDLKDYEANIKRALGPGELSERAWWQFVCGLSGNSITSVMQDAVKRGNRVVLAIPPLQYAVFRDDLKQAVKEISADVIREHVRVVGPELESVLMPKLLPCLMPYDREALDRLVPGVRAHGIRRLARLFVDVCKQEEDGAGNPIDDYEKMVAAFRDKSRAPIQYDTGSDDKVSKLKRLSEDDLAEKISEYAEVCGPIAQRISRMMREDGFSASVESVEEVLGRATRASAGRSSRK